MTLTARQARSIAKALRRSVEAVDEYLDANYQKIDIREYDLLHDYSELLLYESHSLTTTAVGLSIDALEDPATELKNLIKKTKKKIKKLQSVGHVIIVVAALTNLVAAIVAKEPNAIVASVSQLDNLISEENTSDD